MAKYKRADFAIDDEEDSVNVSSSDAIVPNSSGGGGGHSGSGVNNKISNHHLKIHVLPLQPPGIWKSRTHLEKLLLCFSSLIFLTLCLAFICLVRSNYKTYMVTIDPNRGPPCLTPTCVKISATMLTSMDLDANPCDDFYQYACGGWVKTNPIPEGKSSWGTFQKLWLQNQLVLKETLEKEMNSSTNPEAEIKAQKYYQSCLDKNEIQEKLGSQPIIELLSKIKGWSISPSNFELDKWDFNEKLNELHNEYNMGGLFTWAVGEDDRNSSRHIIQIDQGGLVLPTRDYYLNSTHEHVVAAYLTYMTKIVELLGTRVDNSTIKSLRDIIDFEKELANITIPPEDRRDDEKLYHAKNLTTIQELCPVIDWTNYFSRAFSRINRSIPADQMMVVYAPEFLQNMSNLVESKLKTREGKIVVNNYLVWHTVKSMSCCASKAFRDAEKVLRKAILGSDGTEETWKTCVSDTNNNLGFAVGAMFIREAFHSEAKPLAQTMIDKIRTAFQANLWNLKWMDEETRELARDKAEAITDMIGFPEFILTRSLLDKKYEDLTINETDYFGNNLRVNQYSLVKNLEKLFEPVNRTKWGMTPPTVNAYYTPTSNQMVIPAGILQWPFFDPDFPDSINYGAIGVVMGHELTHAFDDQGREYDKTGNLNQWWKNSTIEKFKSQTECVISQYSSYKIENELVNGNTTIGENIADNGGLKASFHAYRKSFSNSNQEHYSIPGLNLTHDQIFFLSFAQVWCSATLKENLILQIQNDPHVPAPLRVKGPLSNLKEFADTYNCPIGSTMNPAKKCTVW